MASSGDLLVPGRYRVKSFLSRFSTTDRKRPSSSLHSKLKKHFLPDEVGNCLGYGNANTTCHWFQALKPHISILQASCRHLAPLRNGHIASLHCSCPEQ